MWYGLILQISARQFTGKLHIAKDILVNEISSNKDTENITNILIKN